MKELYNTIIERLTSDQSKETYRSAGVPACKFIDLFRGQYFDYPGNDLIPCPAVLFEHTIVYDNKGEGTATVTLHLCYEQPRDTSSISRVKENALKFFDFVDVTHDLIRELESTHTGKLQLTNEEIVKDDAIVNVYLLSFSCRYTGRNREKFNYVTGENLETNGRVREFFG